MWLRSGRLVDPTAIDFSKVELYDLAWALANVNRWGGHASPAVSVAKHAIACARACWATPRLALLALHHDDGEAFFGDMCRDLKSHPGMAWYREQEHAATAACIRHFAPSVADLPLSAVKTVDTQSLLTERAWHFPPDKDPADASIGAGLMPLDPELFPKGQPTVIAALFCGMHRVLTRRVHSGVPSRAARIDS